jgi:predicted secreted protein
MSLTLFVAVFFLIWWVVLFAVLPWGVKSQHEGTVEPGTEPGAPQRTLLLRKVLVTTLIAGVLMAAFYAVWVSGAVTLDRLPMPFALPKQ